MKIGVHIEKLNEGIIPLIRKLPVPAPASIEWNNDVSWLTKDGPQTEYRSCPCYPVVRDQNGRSMANVPITIRKKPIASGNWATYSNVTSQTNLTLTADANRGRYIYECYVTANSSISAQLTLPQYYFNYQRDEHMGEYDYLSVLDTANPLISTNVKSIDTSNLLYGLNYFDIVANAAGSMVVAIPLKNAPTILGANSNTRVYIGYDQTRGDTPYATRIKGVGGGMVRNGSRNSMGIFIDASDGDFASSYDTDFMWVNDYGFTEAGNSKECVATIVGGSSGAYTEFTNANGTNSHTGAYWYGSQIGSVYGPCVVASNSSMAADEKMRITIKYIRAVAP